MAHPVFAWTGALDGGFGPTLAVYAVLALVALVMDRRALLLAGLVYFVVAMSGAVEGMAPPGHGGWREASAVVGITLLAVGMAWDRLRWAALAPWRAWRAGLASRGW